MRKVNVLYSMVFMITLFGVSVNHLNACTRVVYQGDNNMIITGRTMDFPARYGAQRRGREGPDALEI